MGPSPGVEREGDERGGSRKPQDREWKGLQKEGRAARCIDGWSAGRTNMKRVIWAIVGAVLLAATPVLPADAGGRGGFHGGGARTTGGGGWHGGGARWTGGGGWHGGGSGWHGGTRVFIGGWWGPGWWGPGYWGPSYAYPYAYPYGYPYYAAPPVAVQQGTQEYIQQGSAPQQQGYWYYCQNPQGYYPYVKECPAGWLQVVPQQQPPSP